MGRPHTHSGCVEGFLGRACQCEQVVICLQSSRRVPWNTFSLVRFSWRWRVADVGFDSDKHAQTNGDMEKGGQSLANSCEAIGRLVEAQNPDHWSQEAGFLAMRTALISFLKTEDRVIRGETGRFEKFDGDVQTAVAAFTAAEQGNTDELARILAQMESGQGGSGSVSAPPPQTSGGSSTSVAQPGSSVGGSSSNSGGTSSGGGTPSNSGGGSNTTNGGGAGAASGTSSADQAPVQNKPSEF